MTVVLVEPAHFSSVLPSLITSANVECIRDFPKSNVLISFEPTRMINRYMNISNYIQEEVYLEHLQDAQLPYVAHHIEQKESCAEWKTR